MSEKQTIKIAIVILNYSTFPDCRKCVSFLKQQQDVEFEIIIVDNCSPKNDREKVKVLCQEQGCTFIAASENRGYNAGNNIGLRYATSKGYKYVLIANPDMEFPQTDYMQKLVEVMERDEEVVVCGSDIVSPEGIHQNPMKRDDWRNSWEWMHSVWRKCSLKQEENGKMISGYCAKVCGCCLMVRMDFMQSIGYFDENIFLYCEEAILSRQVEGLGKKMYYLAEAKAVHRHIKSVKGDPVKRFKYWRDSRFYFIDHYSGSGFLGGLFEKTGMNLYWGSYVISKKLRR